MQLTLPIDFSFSLDKHTFATHSSGNGCVGLLLDKLCNNSQFWMRINATLGTYSTWTTSVATAATARAPVRAPLKHPKIFSHSDQESDANATAITFVTDTYDRFYGSHVMLIHDFPSSVPIFTWKWWRNRHCCGCYCYCCCCCVWLTFQNIDSNWSNKKKRYSFVWVSKNYCDRFCNKQFEEWKRFPKA